ncbi:MAG: hypothetical protein QHG94_08540, partial [Candidatus Methanosuratincola sp.]|nr:hypothetical protein [Candidatus Methanosuratincola sp.]
SLANLTELMNAGYDFIIPAPLTLAEAKSVISQEHADIEDPAFLRKLEGETLFVKEASLQLGELEVHGYLYHDLKREQEEKTSFYDWLERVRERLLNIELKPWQNPARVFEEEAGSLAKYFTWSVREKHFMLEVKKKAIAQRLNRAGKTIVLHSGQRTWQECLLWSRERDVIEKMFYALKNDLATLPLRSQRTEVVKAMIFVNFIALILRTRILAMMKASKLCRDYSLPAVMLELSKLRRMEMLDGSFVTGEVTRKQRKIVEALGLDLERLCA